MIIYEMEQIMKDNTRHIEITKNQKEFYQNPPAFPQ